MGVFFCAGVPVVLLPRFCRLLPLSDPSQEPPQPGPQWTAIRRPGTANRLVRAAKWAYQTCRGSDWSARRHSDPRGSSLNQSEGGAHRRTLVSGWSRLAYLDPDCKVLAMSTVFTIDGKQAKSYKKDVPIDSKVPSSVFNTFQISSGIYINISLQSKRFSKRSHQDKQRQAACVLCKESHSTF